MATQTRAQAAVWTAAAKIADTIGEAAVRIGVTRTTLYNWAKGNGVEEALVPKVAELSGMHPGEIRPDLAEHYYRLYEYYWHEDCEESA
jgi:hypothetical protein